MVRRAVSDGVTPGAVVVVGHGGEVVVSRGWGRLDWTPDAPAATPTTLYDVASVTKVATTTLLTMMLVEEGRLELDAPLWRHLSGWPMDGARGRITLRHLLTHRAGLPAGAAFWRAGEDRHAWIRALARVELRAPPGREERYSDLGPILLGFVLEEVTGQSLESLAERRIHRPLELDQTVFRPLERGVPASRIAPTERLADRHLRGVVHDPSARAMGGVAGNAGLFASARDLATLASALLWEHPRRMVCRDVIRRFTERPHRRRRFGAGWEMPADWTVWGEIFSARAFGHQGFTGTSLWIDPEADLFVVLLTNRVNPTARGDGHRALRRRLHDVVRRAHLAREDEMRAADWRIPSVWRSVDGCRAETGRRLLSDMRTRPLRGW